MNSSEPLWGIGDGLWHFVDDLQPAGSVGDVIGGFFKIPANFLIFLSNVAWDFGS